METADKFYWVLWATQNGVPPEYRLLIEWCDAHYLPVQLTKQVVLLAAGNAISPEEMINAIVWLTIGFAVVILINITAIISPIISMFRGRSSK